MDHIAVAEPRAAARYPAGSVMARSGPGGTTSCFHRAGGIRFERFHWVGCVRLDYPRGMAGLELEGAIWNTSALLIAPYLHEVGGRQKGMATDDPGDASPLTPPFLEPLEDAWKPAYFGGRGQPPLCSAAPKLPRPSPDDGTMETSEPIRVNLWLKPLP